jgi:hypothetical protein
MIDNLRHWLALEKTDPSATKPFERAGGFKGTATKPIYHEKRMTEHFGPCGIGWGMSKPEFQLVTAENETLVYCTVALWYVDGEQIGEVFGVGGDKVVAQQKRGPFVSDEAFKAAFTDALGNAMKHLGVSADIHMGEFDKYGRDRDDARPASARPAAPPSQPSADRPAPQAATSARQLAPAEEAKLRQAAEARERIRAALEKASTPKLVDEIIAINGRDLQLIKDVGPKTYDHLMTLANGRKSEMFGATG